MRPLLTSLALAVLLAFIGASPGITQGILGMPVIGYADRMSVQPGDTIKFMVSSELPRFRADMVRLIHGDVNPNGPGLKEQVVDAPVNKEYPGKHQDLPNGSYVLVPDAPALHQTGSLTLQAWIAATTPAKGVQGIIAKWSETDRQGYALVVDEDGSVGLWLGGKNGVHKVRTGTPLRRSVTAARPFQLFFQVSQMGATTAWYFVTATYDSATGNVAVRQEAVPAWPGDKTTATAERRVPAAAIGESDAPLLIASVWEHRDAKTARPGSFFNGKIDSPRIYSRALSANEIAALKVGKEVPGAVAAWDFSRDINSRKVSDTGPNKLDGRTVNMPTRGMTGHNWSAREVNYQHARHEYGAIHFHDDDLDDAKWDVSFEWQIPPALKSGVYAARLRAGNGEDHIPFFVRPPKGTATARIAFLVPTFSYLAYANFGTGDKRLLSIYDHHSDGSGVTYSSWLRPIIQNFRPKVVSGGPGMSFPHQFNADLHLIDWLEAKQLPYDVITDEDLHHEGTALLKPYKVILTGTHPEYWSTQMMDGLAGYLNGGGRLMYLGGNGFYWITAMDPEERHTVEVRRNHGTETWDAAPGEYYHSTTGELGGL